MADGGAVEAGVPEGLGELSGAVFIADHDGDDVGVAEDRIGKCLELGSEPVGFLLDVCASGFGLDDAEGGEASDGDDWGEGGGINEAAGALDEVVFEFGVAGDEAAHSAESFAQGSHDVVHVWGEIWAEAPFAILAEDAEGMGFIDDEVGVELVLERDECGKIGEVAVHAEDRFGEDDGFLVGVAVFVEEGAEVVEVLVGKAKELGPGELGPVDHTGVAVAIGKDGIVWAVECADEA